MFELKIWFNVCYSFYVLIISPQGANTFGGHCIWQVNIRLFLYGISEKPQNGADDTGGTRTAEVAAGLFPWDGGAATNRPALLHTHDRATITTPLWIRVLKRGHRVPVWFSVGLDSVEFICSWMCGGSCVWTETLLNWLRCESAPGVFPSRLQSFINEE